MTPNNLEPILLGEPYLGLNRGSVKGIGDVNDDGFDDVAIGIPESDITLTNCGTVVILFGGIRTVHRSSFE